MANQGKPVHLTALLVGERPTARMYAENQAKSCDQFGIGYNLRELPGTSPRQAYSLVWLNPPEQANRHPDDIANPSAG